MFVFVISDGLPVASISAAEIALAFMIWGLLMAATGMALMWLFGGERSRHADAGAYRRGRAGARALDETVEFRGVHDDPPAPPAPPPAAAPAGRVHRTGVVHEPAPPRRTPGERTTAVLPRISDAVVTVTRMPAPRKVVRR